MGPRPAPRRPGTRLMMADLVIALGLVSVWMWNDTRQRGATVLPYLALTATFGAAGPLLYLIAREHQLHRTPVTFPGRDAA